jgi:hypothetical protein
MSSRLHNKFHRHNHHTISTNDPRYPDAAHDPIASPEAPFQGDFVVQGSISALGDVQFRGVLSFTDPGSFVTFQTAPLTATGEFIYIEVLGQPRYIRLWSNE